MTSPPVPPGAPSDVLGDLFGPDAAAPSGGAALGWLDAAALGAPRAALGFDQAASPAVPIEPDLLARRPRRSALRPGVLVPVSVIVLVVVAYAATVLLWPLNALAPQVEAQRVTSVPAAAASLAWPSVGSGAVAVQGIDGTVTSTASPSSIASITKVVTALVVLDQMPLKVGEQGPTFRFTAADHRQYVSYLRRDESALDVPVGGSLSEYQMLEGMLIGSASNYADRLVNSLFPSDAVFASAAQTWLSNHGVAGITIVEPTGIEHGNKAAPAALIALAQRAMANPVIAQIVAEKSVDLPGAGHVVNTNGLLDDAGVVGVKTGSLDADNLLAAKDVTIGSTPVRIYAVTLDQPNDATRVSATRDLFAQVQEQLRLRPSVAAGTSVAEVTTRWGEKVDVVTGRDADVVLWNGGTAEVSTNFTLGEHRHEGDTVGTLTATGPLDTVTVPLRLSRDVDGPSPWWRLTHPLALFGLDG